MKTPLVIVFAGFLFTSGELFAQSNDSSEVKRSFSEIFDFKPLQLDSLENSLNTVGAKAFLMSKNWQEWRGIQGEMAYTDPNMPVLSLPKDHKGTLGIVQLPENYSSRMPVKRLKESQESAFIVPPKK